jgi:hypothetical protein
MPATDWNKGNSLRIEANLLDISCNFFTDFIEPCLQQINNTLPTIIPVFSWATQQIPIPNPTNTMHMHPHTVAYS